MNTKDRIIHGLSKALWDSDLVATRLSLSLAELFWAIMLFWPGDTFDRPTYHVMSKVMSEEAWAFVILLSSATQISIVMCENYHSTFSRMFAGWNASLWGFLCVSMAMSVYPPPAAVGGEFALAIAALWVWVRPFILMEGYKRAYGTPS